MKNLLQRRAVAWASLVGVLAVFFLLLVRLHPTNFFGLTEDDTIYFSSAKALAEGRGYVRPSLPGSPPEHRYPVAYPWLLSWVWRWNPSFPANVKDAVALTAAFGAAFIILIYLFLRRLGGLSEGEALLLTAFCAWSPHVLFYSGNVMTEIPFATLMLAAVLAGDVVMRREARVGGAVAAGVFAGLAMLVRVLGVPVAAGIFVAGAMRRSWRQLAVFCASVAPFFAALAWNATFSMSAAAVPTGAVRPNAAWDLQWAYYTSYIAFWRMTVPNVHTLGAMLLSNAETLATIFSTFFLLPLVNNNTIAGQTVWLLTEAAVVVGIVRQARRHGWRPIHFVLPFYLAVALFYFFPADRYLFPFLPLFAAGLWFEGKHIFGMVRAGLTSNRGLSEKVVAVALGAGLAALAGGIGWNYAGGARSTIEARSEQRGAMLQEKREAYDWLRGHSPPDARVIADEDAMLYLYAGRQAARPILLLGAGIFEPARLEAQLAGICDTARAIGAEYWVMSDDDFAMAWPEATRKARAREAQLEQVLPLVFRSREGRVRIYSLGCVHHPEEPSCQSADRVLFP